jgi:hypothetical protein
VVGGFSSIHEWHPAIAKCEMFETEGTTHRRLTTADGVELLEKLLTHDDAAMSYTYSIEQSPLPVLGYVAEIRVATDANGTWIGWLSRFLPKGVSDADARSVIMAIYEPGLANVEMLVS